MRAVDDVLISHCNKNLDVRIYVVDSQSTVSKENCMAYILIKSAETMECARH